MATGLRQAGARRGSRGSGRTAWLLALAGMLAWGMGAEAETRFRLPDEEELQYTAEWRLLHAGDVILRWKSPLAHPAETWNIDLTIRSAGVVNALYSVNNHYTSRLDKGMCSTDSLLHASEGSKRRETRVVFDRNARQASYRERDLKTNTVISERTIEIGDCVREVMGSLYYLRALEVPPGTAVDLPVSDGKKSVSVRVEAQRRETLDIGGRKMAAIRYEAFLFRNVLYRRDASAFVWLSDDEERLPVQVRIRMPFYIGTVTLQLKHREAR